MTSFSTNLLDWYDRFGRKELPWKLVKDAYRIWVSEIMLQQTQVQTVLAYYLRFMDRFPTVDALAKAPEDEVLALWSGLGYYSRARNLHACAKIISEKYNGQFPKELELLTDLPGIGPSTAAAILSQAYDLPTAILDANVKRVLARVFAVTGYPEQGEVKKRLWRLAQTCMPNVRCADYTQAIMDLGSLCCKNRNPDCLNCPVQKYCEAFKSKEQHLYPTKKPKKSVPTKQQQFLILKNNQDAIYLEKRPPTGIWGGLWCFPALEMEECALEFIETRYALKGDEPVLITQFKHQFSHFHLEINAMEIRTKTMGNQIAESSGAWFKLNEIKNIGLAKPTQIILKLL